MGTPSPSASCRERWSTATAHASEIIGLTLSPFQKFIHVGTALRRSKRCVPQAVAGWIVLTRPHTLHDRGRQRWPAATGSGKSMVIVNGSPRCRRRDNDSLITVPSDSVAKKRVWAFVNYCNAKTFGKGQETN